MAEHGLSQAEAQRRLLQYGPNQIVRRTRKPWHKLLWRQVSHPLALLLWMAAGLAWLAGAQAISVAIVGIVVLNALFAFVQETQAEKAVEALAGYIPQYCRVWRDGESTMVQARDLAPGDTLLLLEGDRISADAKLLSGSLEVDMSQLSGESLPVLRLPDGSGEAHDPLLASNMVFSGSSVIGGEAKAQVTATGMHSQIGRIAALSERVEIGQSPLEAQVRRVAWIIAAVALLLGIAFLPLAIFAAGLPVGEAAVFAVALLVGNVPEGLLPVITLSLALGAKNLAARGAIIKRLSAVETLGSTTVICTDKTGTITQNKMRVYRSWGDHRAMLETGIRCCSVQNNQTVQGDPTELALWNEAQRIGIKLDSTRREQQQIRRFAFDAGLKRMTTVDKIKQQVYVHCKGAPESVMPLCQAVPEAARESMEEYASQGLRVLALARRTVRESELEGPREKLENDLQFLGLIALEDPPRPEVA
ncbi:MAG: HAD-IC family P-type ATPase, partial [Bacteroidota bacterium]